MSFDTAKIAPEQLEHDNYVLVHMLQSISRELGRQVLSVDRYEILRHNQKVVGDTIIGRMEIAEARKNHPTSYRLDQVAGDQWESVDLHE